MRFSVDDIARICHDTNRAYSLLLRDHSNPSWEFAPQWVRTSVLHGVMFHLENPHADERASHENWLAERAADGWQYGEVKNPETKEHPYFVPFDDLSPEQQVKDRLFKAVIQAMLVE